MDTSKEEIVNLRKQINRLRAGWNWHSSCGSRSVSNL